MNIDRLLIKGPNDNDFVPADDMYNLYLMWRRLSAPELKSEYVEIAGANGTYDGTEDYGEVFYNDRVLNLGCIMLSENWHATYEAFLNRYHGQTCQFAFANDPAYYWGGRLSVSEYDSKAHQLSMSAIVYPYKFKRQKTVVRSNGNETVRLRNGRMRVVPSVTIGNDVTLKWGNNTKALQSSSYPATYLIAGLELNEGYLDVQIVGNATVSFEYREGSL